jgi:hypothetical protein
MPTPLRCDRSTAIATTGAPGDHHPGQASGRPGLNDADVTSSQYSAVCLPTDNAEDELSYPRFASLPIQPWRAPRLALSRERSLKSRQHGVSLQQVLVRMPIGHAQQFISRGVLVRHP